MVRKQKYQNSEPLPPRGPGKHDICYSKHAPQYIINEIVINYFYN